MVTPETCTELINSYLPEPEAGLLAGILLGVRADMDRPLYEALLITGTLHIVALSGANISILAGLIGSSLSKLRISRRITGLLNILIIIGFVGFVGPTPSVVRAAIMASLALLSQLAGKSVWPVWIWVVTTGIMLSLSPRLATDISFQLSAGATLGIILFGCEKLEVGRWKLDKPNFLTSNFKFLTSVYQTLIADLHTTLSAQVFTIPIIVYHFHRISLISPIPNLLIGWLIGPLMGFGYLILLAGTVFKPLGQLLAWFIYLPLAYIIAIIEFFGKIPLAAFGY
jgi:competence protein ComEC